MTETIATLSFNAGQNWLIALTAHDDDGVVLPLLSGVGVEFRMSELIDGEMVPRITKTLGDGITVIDDDAGRADVLVTVADQTAATIAADRIYFYEIRTISGLGPIMQARGQLKVEGSLFKPETTDPLLREFRIRFPEIDAADERVMLFIGDAQRIVNSDPSWRVDMRNIAIMYLAAHMLLSNKSSSSQYASGGVETGAVKSISVEDRSVSFETGKNSSSGSTSSKYNLSQTGYGVEYLRLMRQQTVFLNRA